MKNLICRMYFTECCVDVNKTGNKNVDRVNRILNHKLYLEYIKKIKIFEQDRTFCKHDTVHFLDVCRLAEIDWLNQRIQKIEEDYELAAEHDITNTELMQLEREYIYAAGLLHDIGRWQEYESGVRHEKASAVLAPEILRDCGFLEEEVQNIIYAILNHRNCEIADELSLAGMIYRADKKSRPCYFCEAQKECDWSAAKKNLKIK